MANRGRSRERWEARRGRYGQREREAESDGAFGATTRICFRLASDKHAVTL